MWEAIIGSPISPEQVCLCMAALKMAREAGQHEADNIEDAMGYLSMIPEVQDNLNNRMQAGPLPVEREQYDPMRAAPRAPGPIPVSATPMDEGYDWGKNPLGLSPRAG